MHIFCRPRPGHRHKYTKCEKCLGMTTFVCIKLHLSYIWCSTDEKFRSTKTEIKKTLFEKAIKYFCIQDVTEPEAITVFLLNS